MKVTLILIAISLSSSLQSKTLDLELLLKARGLQALERIETLSKKNGKSQGKNLSKKELCEWNLEKIYYGFSIPDLTKTLIKKFGTVTKYALLINEDSTSGPQIHYGYDHSQSNIPIGTEIFNLNNVWRATISKKMDNYILISSDKCMYFFNDTDPLDSFSSSKD